MESDRRDPTRTDRRALPVRREAGRRQTDAGAAATDQQPEETDVHVEPMTTDATLERRRAPRALRLPKDLLEEGAWPATTTELARWTGMSDDFIRREEDAGAIKGVRTRGGGRLLFPAPEAVRYLREMGVL